LVRARLGLQPAVLDLPVKPGGRLLYLAMDRPQQIARRLLQQFTPAELDDLDARMDLGVGPPPQDMARRPELLTALCEQAKADTVVVDSLKDAAIGLVDDEVGAGWNRARQLAVAAGVEVLELHHLVKRGANGKDPETLADVYGSAWLTAGAGSVLVLLGDAGSPIVKARHLKPVAEPFGPVELAHDHARGVTTVHHRVDLLELVAITRVQACQVFDTGKPKPGEVEHARRRLEQLHVAGKVHRRQVTVAGRLETQYVPLTARSLQELQETPAPQPAAPFTPLEMEEPH
jgi:replicative DNA helicase